MDEGDLPDLQSSKINQMEDEYDAGLPLSAAFRFPSVEDDHEDKEEDYDNMPQLVTPPTSAEFNYLQEAHPASKSLKWLFGVEFLLMTPLLPLEMLLPAEWSLPLILLYSFLLLAHVIMALSLFGLLYDPWHNNIVKTLRVHQGVLGVCSLLMLSMFGYLVCADAASSEGHDAAMPDELSSTLAQHGRSMPYHLGSAAIWVVLLLICLRCFVTLTRQKFDISTGTGCCPVIRCRACRVTCFLGLPDAAVGLRYHQHHGSLRDIEGISINTLQKRELSASKPRTLPLPGEDGSEHNAAHFDKRGSVDYFAPIWKTQKAAATKVRRNSDIDTPRLSGSAPSEWSRWPAPPIEIKKKESPYMVSRSVGHVPLQGKVNPDLRAPLLAHADP